MVTLAILGLLIALAIPNINKTLIVRHVDGTFREVSNLLKLASSTARAQNGAIQVTLVNTTINHASVVQLQMFDESSAALAANAGQPRLLRDYISPNDVEMTWVNGGTPGSGGATQTGNLTINYWGTGAADDGTGDIVAPGTLVSGLSGTPPPIRINFASTNHAMTISNREADISIATGQVVQFGL